MVRDNGAHMLKNIYLSNAISDQAVDVISVEVASGQRVRSGQLLMRLKKVDGTPLVFESAYNGWLRFVAVRPSQTVDVGSLLIIIDTQDVADYRIDSEEVNPHTELGKDGRRGVERDGQKAFTEGYAIELFDAPEQQQGDQAQRRIKQHPLLQHMKEGVPPKMSNAHNNQQAIDRLAEDATHDPELRLQLDNKLQAQLGMTPGPSSAPTLSRG